MGLKIKEKCGSRKVLYTKTNTKQFDSENAVGDA